MASLGEARARAALDEAAALARRAGLSVSTKLRTSGSPAEVLLDECGRHDLLALGTRGGSRAGGIILSSIASHAAHETKRPLLIARPSTHPRGFPRRVLLATNGSPGSWAALRAALGIAHARASEVILCHVPDGLHPEWTRQIERQVAMLEEVTGVEPRRIDEPGRTAELIVDAAGRTGSSLIVIGHRGLAGVRALGSVSEQVVHRAPCSTLLMPPTEAPG
jgi:nucleotide-binding universal stress UspA family protein